MSSNPIQTPDGARWNLDGSGPALYDGASSRGESSPSERERALEDALRPFAAMAYAYENVDDDEVLKQALFHPVAIAVGDVRRAAALLASPPPAGGAEGHSPEVLALRKVVQDAVDALGERHLSSHGRAALRAHLSASLSAPASPQTPDQDAR